MSYSDLITQITPVVRVVGVVRMLGVVRMVGEVRMVRVVGVRMVTLLTEHYFVQSSVGRLSFGVLRVSCPKNLKNTSLLLTGLLTGVSR